MDDTNQLQKIYDKISAAIQDRNGLVVDYNPLLTALLGCNTNMLFLGSKEQSRGALFYIGPYINKNGVEIIDALPLIVKAQDDAVTYLSVAEDSGTEKRTVQHTLHKTLNKLNSQMEVSDTQAAGALFDLDARITSEIFSYYNANGYKNFILDTRDGLHQASGPVGMVDDLGENDTDEDSQNAESGDEGDDMSVDGSGEENYDTDDDESDNDSCSDEEDSEEGENTPEQTNEEDGKEGDIWREWENDSCEKFNLSHKKGDYGTAKIFSMGQDEETGKERFHAISYPELYRYRGRELKGLNRLEYCALVSIVPKKKNEKNRRFEFGLGLDEKIGSKYCQMLKSRQCTPKLFCKLPPHPGEKPSDPKKARQWEKKAEKFAFHFLAMFRPEDKLYGSEIYHKYDYDWSTFLKFESKLRCSDRAIDHSRLELMERYVHGWKVNTTKRMKLLGYRGRNRTKWSDQQKEMARSCKTKAMENHWDVFEYEGHDHFAIKEMSSAHQTKNIQVNRHKRDCVDIIDKLAPEVEEDFRQYKEHITFDSTNVTLPFDSTSYENMKEAEPADLDSTDTNQPCCPVPYRTKQKVDRYLAEQDLSDDKAQAVQILRDHFTAMHEGRSEADDYEAPYLMVCGGPGNGKSKLVETIDGMSTCMNVGRLVKTAFVGGAAVNINGSSLIGLFDIPVIEKGDGSDQSKYNVIKPWSDEKRKAFKKKYALEKITCIIVDEISTVKPYMLAYLNARLMDLYPDCSKIFGGRAVVLLGDFDQLPPVGGDSLAGAVMKYEEERYKKNTGAGPDAAISLEQRDVGKCLDIKTTGIMLFGQVRYIKLTTQHRSKDPEHTSLLTRMSSDGTFHSRRLSSYKSLSQKDMDQEFAFATMVVTGNAERHELNALQAKRWASKNNTKVVRWFRKRQQNMWKGKPRDPLHVEMAMRENCFYERFVPGAAGYITENINTDIGLANGVEIKYHSLSFESEDEDRVFKDEFENGQSLVMTLDRPPDAINVELFADFDGDSDKKRRENIEKRREWTHGSLVDDGRVVIQISRQWGSKLVRKWANENIEGSYQFGYSGSILPMKDHFPIEPGFCVTIYKAQVSLIYQIVYPK